MEKKSDIDIKHKLNFIFFSLIFLIIPVFSEIEGLYDNSDWIDKFYEKEAFAEENETLKSFYKIDYYDDFTDYLESALFLSRNNENNSNLAEMYSLYKAGRYSDVIEFDSKNYLEDYLKLSSFYKLKMYDMCLNYIDNYKQTGIAQIDSIFNILCSAVYYQNKEYEKAIMCIQNNQDDYSLFIKGMSEYAMHDESLALMTLSSIKSEITEPQTSYILMLVSYKNRDYSNAMNYIEKIENNYPDFYKIDEVKYDKANILYKRGYFRRSIISLQDIVMKSDTDNYLTGNAYYLMGKNYFMIGDYDRMEEYLSFLKQSLVKSDYKKNAEFLDGKGFYLKGDYKKAVSKLEYFIKIYPEDELVQYAYQLISQSYFYLKKYKNSAEYINKLKYPEFFVEKVVMMKYFIDYKNGEYKDSISAYLAFIDNENNNPMRKEVFEKIFQETTDDSLKLWALTNLMIEFPESDGIPDYLKSEINAVTANSGITEIKRIIYLMKKYKPERLDEVFILFIKSLNRLGMYESIIELYSEFSAILKASKSEVEFITAVSLAFMKNIDGSLIMLDKISLQNGEYADSAKISFAKILYENGKVEILENYVVKHISENNNYVSGELMRYLGKTYHDQKKYQKAKESFLKSAELFSDYRNMAALSLLDCSKTVHEMQDDHEAMLLAEKAMLFATDITLINRIKVQIDEYR